MADLKKRNDASEGLIIKGVIALIFPALAGAIYCALRGVSISQLFVPASYNNDCLMYYKQIEAMLYRGVATGYFGYNESHALIGNLAAWSPVIYLPWLIWGALFGWNATAPLLCNVVLLGVAFCFFVMLTKPDYLSFFAGLFTLLLFPSFAIHVLSGLPEAVLTAYLIVFLGLSIRLCESVSKADRNNKRIAAMLTIAFAIIIMLTLIRPYMIMFIALPVYTYRKAFGKKTLFVSGLIIMLTLAGYYCLNKYFTSGYFFEMYDVSIIKALVKGHLIEALRLCRDVGMKTVIGIVEYISDAFRYGLTAGTQYFMSVSALFLALLLFAFESKTSRRFFYLVYVISLIALLGAIVFILQEPNEGARHLWMFAVTGCLLFTNSMDGQYGNRIPYWAVRIISIVLLSFFLIKGSLVPTDYDIPVGTDRFKEAYAEWENGLSGIEVNTETDNRFENTVIWVLSDDSNRNDVGEVYAPLYALPGGLGINLCFDWYVINNYDSLESRYIYTHKDSEVASVCEKDMKIVASAGNMVVFERP